MPGRVWASTALVVAIVLVAAVRIAAPGSAAPEPVRVSTGAVTIVEGDAGTRVARIPVTLSAPSRTSLRVHYAVAPYQPLGGAAVDADDMDAPSGTLRFDVSPHTGVTPVQASIALHVASDTMPEPIESFSVTLSDLAAEGPAGAAVIGTPVAVGTVFDDDRSSTTRVSVGTVTMPEGGPGVTHVAHVPVTLSSPAPTPVSVHYAVKGITATHGVDFDGPSAGTVTFPPGVVDRSIDVPVLGDDRAEPDETIAVGLTDPSGAALGNPLGVVLVRDPTSFGRTPGPHVTITGDSITELTEGALRNELAPSYSSSILAVPGATMAVMTPYLRDQLGSAPDAAVVSLGTNDVLTANPGWARSLATIRAMVASQRCVVYVTVDDTVEPARRVLRPPTGHDRRQINAVLRAAAATSPNVHLVDWKTAVDADAAPGGAATFTVDGIHPSVIGQAWLAQHIHTALTRDCR